MSDHEHDDYEQLAQRVRDAVAEVVAGTDWAPPDGILVDCVVMMGWYQSTGSYGCNHLRAGSPWATHGLVEDQLERMTLLRERENAAVDDGDE